jgi:hypothetical protein
MERFVPEPGPLEMTSGIIPCDERDGRHQDRAQAVAVRLNDGVEPVESLCAQFVRVIDLQDRVLLYDAEEQKQAEAGKDVDRLPRQQEREDAERGWRAAASAESSPGG